MKSLMSILQWVLNDLGTWCGISTVRDFKTASDRFEHEGESFLTISLSNFGADFQKSLDQGFVGDDQYLGFAKTGRLPRFLSGFFRLVFDEKTGRLIDVPSLDAIYAIRQLTLMWAKIYLPCKPARVEAAMRSYIDCEKEIRRTDAQLREDHDRSSRFERIGSMLFNGVFSTVDRQVYYGEITAKHGPGSTADYLLGNDKWNQQEWTARLEEVFPHGENLVSSWRYFLQYLQDVNILEPGAERPTRVIPVPKTLKSPRIIAIEPTCMQYMQQGLMASIREAVSRDDILRQLIGSSSQVPNQHLARQGSRNGTLATLDLSEASDRVSNQHVRRLLRNHPHLNRGVDASRSRKADVPGHGVIRLAKFASMGSGLCFDFEAMVFVTIIFVAIEKDLNRRLTKRDIRSYLGQVRVFGDDIIVPKDFAFSVVGELAAFGLKVNTGKSFWTGKFRESCGRDFYDGHDISIVRVRRKLPTQRKDVREILAWVSTRNQFYKAGLWGTVREIDDLLKRLIPFPTVEETSPLLGRHSYIRAEYSDYKQSDRLHSPLVRGVTAVGRSPVSQLDNYGALLKCLLLLESKSSSQAYGGPAVWEKSTILEHLSLPAKDSEHLERSGRPRAVTLKPRWGSPF